MPLFADLPALGMPEWAVEAVKQFPLAGILVVAGVFMFRYISREHAKHIASKDAEIERLVAEKKELQKLFMERLRSTEELPGKPKKTTPVAKEGPEPPAKEP